MASVSAPNSSFLNATLPEQTINGQQSSVKLEPQSLDEPGSTLSDEDLYEDAGDLDYTASTQALILARIPKFLWENWTQLGDDDEIEIGTIRFEGGPEDSKRMSLLLNSTAVKSQNVPLEYNMHIMNRATLNTFIFTEQDLPGYSSKSATALKPGGHAETPSISRMIPPPKLQHRTGQGFNRIDKSKKWQPYFRKAIPKNTALVGQIKMEVNCLPVENAEYRRVMDQRTRQAMKPKRETKLLTGVISSHGGNLLAPGTLGSSGSFDTFIKHTGPKGGKPQESKAARIPQNELLDRIYDCFKRYNYWPLKSLKAELKQPEAYLKQTLELVAHLVRQGTHAMTWQLKPESKIGAYADKELYGKVKDEAAPDIEFDGTFDGAFDAAFDGEEFEDIFPSDDNDESLR